MMKITFLGTGADTAYPLPFCHCEYCAQSRLLGGPNLRKRSSLLLNEDLLIDLGPDVMSASFMHGVSIDNVKVLLQTHAHADHFDAGHLHTRIPDYVVEGIQPLHIAASQGTLNKMSIDLQRLGYVQDLMAPDEQKRLNCQVVPLKPGRRVQLGNYEILPIASNHDPIEESLLYAIQQDGKSILYGTDTDSLTEESLSMLAGCGLHFDAVVLDHTYGWDVDGGGHFNGNKFMALVEFLKANHLVKEYGRIYATHISHEGNPPHDEFNRIAQDYAYEAAYDGLQLEV